MSEPLFKLKRRILRSGLLYEPGAVVRLGSEAEAKELLAISAGELVAGDQFGFDAPDVITDEMILEAVGKLDPVEHFTLEGKPSVLALGAMIGALVTIEQRDAFWAKGRGDADTPASDANAVTDKVVAQAREQLGIGDEPTKDLDPGTAAVSDEEIVQAIHQLDKDKPDQFTKGGKPEVKAIEKILGGRQISAKQRDAAWAVIEAAGAEDSDSSKDNGSA
tara:strand:+ start:10619 stop:11278 length:660 start_codon:yes stop_codon:yes gene_type:complete